MRYLILLYLMSILGCSVSDRYNYYMDEVAYFRDCISSNPKPKKMVLNHCGLYMVLRDEIVDDIASCLVEENIYDIKYYKNNMIQWVIYSCNNFNVGLEFELRVFNIKLKSIYEVISDAKQG